MHCFLWSFLLNYFYKITVEHSRIHQNKTLILSYEIKYTKPIKVRNGHITTLLEDYGIVDNEFYFQKTTTSYVSRPLREGDQVRVFSHFIILILIFNFY
jgi:hypothetical protein